MLQRMEKFLLMTAQVVREVSEPLESRRLIRFSLVP